MVVAPRLATAANVTMICGVMACVGILTLLQNGGGNTTQIIGGILHVVASSLISCGERCCQCRPVMLLTNVRTLSSVAVTCHLVSLILTIVLTLPWWDEFNEWDLGWVNGLIVYGMVIDVLSIVSGVYLQYVVSTEIRVLRSNASSAPSRRRNVSRETIRRSR